MKKFGNTDFQKSIPWTTTSGRNQSSYTPGHTHWVTCAFTATQELSTRWHSSLTGVTGLRRLFKCLAIIGQMPSIGKRSGESAGQGNNNKLEQYGLHAVSQSKKSYKSYTHQNQKKTCDERQWMLTKLELYRMCRLYTSFF